VLGIVVIIIVTVSMYALFVTLYSQWLFPVVPRGLGGGSPEMVIIIAAHEDVPVLIVPSTRAKCAPVGEKVVRCDGLYLFHSDEHSVILVDGARPPAAGVLVSRERLRSISWLPQK
jgi:hypothetical protein